MLEIAEKIVRVGLKRDAKKVFDEIEAVSADMMRNGWKLDSTCFEESFAFVHLIFQREWDVDKKCVQ
jgi:hypothetical protein